MDYCSTCRRHLNGALACPGCGAYASDIAPLAVVSRAPYAATGGAERQAPAEPWNEVDSDSGAEESGRAPQEQPYDGSDVPSASASVGRAARRRQRERWKKTQRRALVATAVALVGGGMTVSSLNRQSPERAQAATAPDREVMGIAEEEATEPVPVSSTPTGTRRAERTSPVTAGSPTANAPHEQSAVTPRATPTAPAAVRQDSVKVPLTAVTASAASQAASTVAGATDTDTVTETTASPTPSATDSTGTSDTDTSSATPSPSESSSSSSSSSSSGICLLGLVCIS